MTGKSGAKSGALGAQSGAPTARLGGASAGPIDADLAAVVAAWPTLTAAERKKVLTAVTAGVR